ncbi:MAG: glycosyltransferase family 4 protein [Thermoplasmata archaeon]
MSDRLTICVDTQTPLVQLLRPVPTRRSGAGTSASIYLSQLKEGVDYRYTPGGVTRMVYPLLRHLLADGVLSAAHWVSLNPSGTEEIRLGHLALHGISLGQARLAGYGQVKEAFWGAVHGTTEKTAALSSIFWSDNYSEFGYYNRLCASRIASLEVVHDFDLFYVHDFQQLPLGQMLGTLKPKIFRWHIPFDASMIPPAWRPRFSTYLNSYDAVIVSSTRYLAALRALGYTGRARIVHPYVDPKEYGRPARAEVGRLAARLGLAPSDRVVLVVARMDPMKAQDRTIRAIARLAGRHPDLKLVLVGNGSFSSSKQGVGLSKSARWREELERLARRLGVAARVVFAGHLSQAELDAIYERSSFTVLPSVREGFGLVVVESWLHGKAAIVNTEAGIVDLIHDGKNGLLVDSGNTAALAEAMEKLFNDPELAGRLGRAGRATAPRCLIDTGLRAERAVIEELL